MKHRLKELLLELQGGMKIETAEIKKLFMSETGIDRNKFYRLWKDCDWELTPSEIFASIAFFKKYYRRIGRKEKFVLDKLYVIEATKD